MAWQLWDGWIFSREFGAFDRLTFAQFGAADREVAINCGYQRLAGAFLFWSGAGAAPSSWQSYCWLNLSDYNDATALTTGQAMSLQLSDGTTTSGLTFDGSTQTDYSKQPGGTHHPSSTIRYRGRVE